MKNGTEKKTVKTTSLLWSVKSYLSLYQHGICRICIRVISG